MMKNIKKWLAGLTVMLMVALAPASSILSVAASKSVKKEKCVVTNSVVKSMNKSIKKVKTNAKKAKVEGDYRLRVVQAGKFLRKLDKIENKLDRYEDRLESQYDRRAIKRKTYLKKDRQLEKLEDKLDNVEEYIEYKFDIDD